LEKIREELRRDLDDWRKLLSKHVAQARQILRKFLIGKLVFTPKQDENGKWYYDHGQGTQGRLLQGASLLPKTWVSPAGFEPAFSALPSQTL